LANTADELDREGAFDPKTPEDARKWVLRAIVIRRGQPLFRNKLLKAYGRRCAITEFDAEPALEAAHIKPFNEAGTNSVRNGILLRADLHTLFDLHLIAIDPRDCRLRVSGQLSQTAYWALDGKYVRMPKDSLARPDRDAIELRWQTFTEQEGNGGRS